jgi:uroporphyrin-III C-methyltransferase
MSSGKVYLVGAGPGDPDLITRKGLRLIQTADVIIYDRLIPAGLLDEARPDAERINAGKLPTKHRLSQDVINELIVSHAQRGKMVVRLKGGDPFVFGRGSEEALVCRQADIPFEIVPGISSSYAVPAYAGIPLTHRHVSSAFTVITGHEDPTKPQVSIQYDAVAQMGGTIVILMGVSRLPQIMARLIAGGLDPQTPAASIEWGATERQRVIVGAVATLPDLCSAADIQSPATTIIGAVVNLREEGARWFDAVLEPLGLREAYGTISA